MSDKWYDDLRNRYKPDNLRVLLIGESPPDPGSATPRFFYSPHLLIDNLYRGVAEAVYGVNAVLNDKPQPLGRLRDDGFWLIDAIETPVNWHTTSQRRRAISDSVTRLAERCLELKPSIGVIICHGMVFKLSAETLRESGVPILHDQPIPFPLGNWRRQFVSGLRECIPTYKKHWYKGPK